MTERLTTLAAVKDWLDITSDASDVGLVRLIDAASRFILNYLNYDTFSGKTYTQTFRGNGKGNVLLRRWPVIEIISSGVGGATIDAGTFGGGSGYILGDPRSGPQALYLHGYSWYYGSPCQVVYRAGYEGTETFILGLTDDQTSVASPSLTCGQWVKDVSVTIGGVAAVLVTGTPTTGRYALSSWGDYIFAVADTGKTAIITYGYVPWDVSWAVTEIIGEWYRRKDRIGLLSKTLGGQETVTFSQKEMSDSAMATLQPYLNVVPL